MHTNRLIHESSPYLRQHAHNPVDWYPWGPEALARARKEDRPIFLSVGYSSCYWCHVMERESFANPSIAAEMNRRFICIKVDREQRPDLDQLYMTAVQLISGSGGWPMSMFLTPEGKPFYGGTYYPPEDLAGRPGFATVLRAIAGAWENKRSEIVQSADQLLEAIQRFSLPAGAQSDLSLDQALVDSLVGRSVGDYDKTNGGFGHAPKFPRETLLELLLHYTAQAEPKPQIRQMLELTLDAMARGGIHDQLGGGFHRYATDAQWLIPHFEIMLYDNAMLLWIYTEAARQWSNDQYARVARGIADFVLREMTGPAGEFFTAFDAEVEGREGDNYLWTAQQMEQVLTTEQAKLAKQVYGLDVGANFADPHQGDGHPDKNVLYQAQTLKDLAGGIVAEQQKLQAQLEVINAKLLQARQKRQGPLLDTKVLTGWCGLMIRGLAHAGKVLQEPTYLAAACKAADFLLQKHRLPDGGLYRGGPEAKQWGFLDDYAALAQGLLALHDATGQPRWRNSAVELVEQMQRRFVSVSGAFYFTDAGADDLLVRQATASDSPLPAGNGLAALVLLELGQDQSAQKIIAAFADNLDQQGEACSCLGLALLQYVARHGAIAVQASDVPGEMTTLEQRGQQAVQVKASRVDQATLQVQLALASGFHCNGPKVPAGLVPTKLNILPPAVGMVFYPPVTRELHLPNGQAIGIYEGQISLEVKHTTPATEPINMVLQIQPCSEDACLRPMRLELRVLPD